MDDSRRAPPSSPGRGLIILFTMLMVAACLIALVATTLYLTGAYMSGPAIPEFTR
jgi:hypothetical protein